MNLSKLCATTIIVPVLFMSACSKENNNTSSQASGAENRLSSTAQPAPKTVSSSINLNTPLDQYITVNESYWARKIDGGASEFVLVYYALCNCAANYNEIAANISEEFRNSESEFDKKALLNKLKPDIDSQLAKFKASQFIKFTSWWVTLGSYDFEKKSFPVVTSNLYDDYQQRSLDERHIRTVSNSELGRDLGLHYVNARSVKSIYVPDETQARQIETLNQLGDSPLRLVIYGHVQSAGIEKIYEKNMLDNKSREVSKRVINIQVVKYSLNKHEEKPFGDVLAGPFAAVE